MKYSLLAATTLSAAMAFAPTRNAATRTPVALQVATDPSVVTKKEYEDICGVSFDDESLKARLKATNYLYPKHVEVIEDIAPIAAKMVDDVVRVAKVILVLRSDCPPMRTCGNGLCLPDDGLCTRYSFPHMYLTLDSLDSLRHCFVWAAFGNRRARLATPGLSP